MLFGCKSELSNYYLNKPTIKSLGKPIQLIPQTPKPNPNHPHNPISSLNNHNDINATAKGWESIITEPNPAPVRTNPSARNP